MKGKPQAKLFTDNPQHEVIAIRDGWDAAYEQRRMTVLRAMTLFAEAGVESCILEEDVTEEETHSIMIDGDNNTEIDRVRDLLSRPLRVGDFIYWVPPKPQDSGVHPQWDWHETNPAWFEAKCDGKVYAVGLGTFNLDDTKLTDNEIWMRGDTWITYWYLELQEGGKECRKIMHQPRFARLVEAQAWIEDLHERGKDKSGIIGG